MANYNEETMNGDVVSWTRAKKITVTNEYLETPSITYEEESKATLPDDTIVNVPLVEETVITEELTGTTEEFNLVNPTTGASLGTATYGDVQVMMHSLYLYLAGKRDAE